MKLSDYKDLVSLDTKFDVKNVLHSMADYERALLNFINLISANDSVLNTNLKDRRKVIRAKLNVLSPLSLSQSQIESLDSILQFELKNKIIIEHRQIDCIKEENGTKISLWKGDITELKIDSIVNAANSQLEGCYQPLHSCIDNAIHSAAGVQLRDDCAKIITKQGHLEPTGKAKITRAYNLPSKYVIHTVGPIVRAGLSETDKHDLYNSYLNCLNLSKELGLIKSVAFCCISTGVYGFPKTEASEIAVKAVLDWVMKNPNKLEHILFNVFDVENESIYKEKLQNVY